MRMAIIVGALLIGYILTSMICYHIFNFSFKEVMSFFDFTYYICALAVIEYCVFFKDNGK